jgi:DNA-directed RNA polymerase specialized sigma24 family protein
MMRSSQRAARKATLLHLRCAEPSSAAPPEPAKAPDPRPEMVCFRDQTMAMVRHYFELSSQLGRLPSLMGREFFRAKVSHHAIPSFEEQAVFVRDVELSIGKLNAEHQEIVTIAGLYSFSQQEIAAMLHISRASVSAWFAEALDALSEIFLQAGLLRENRPDRRQRQVMRRHSCAARLPKKRPHRVQFAPDARGAPAAVPRPRSDCADAIALGAVC